MGGVLEGKLDRGGEWSRKRKGYYSKCQRIVVVGKCGMRIGEKELGEENVEEESCESIVGGGS